MQQHPQNLRPSAAFVMASWLALFVGIVAFIVGLWRADMVLNEKGYYFTVLMYGLFASVSLQKSVRDRLDGIRVTDIYFGLCWFSVILTMVLLSVGLWNANLAPSDKGFYAMAFVLCLFASVTVQKNIRDTKAIEGPDAEVIV